MKNIIIWLAILNGGWMLIDGIWVLLYGKYIGPAKPGPWTIIFEKFGINVFGLGPLFIAYGIAWLTFVWLYSSNYEWSMMFGIILSVLTLWYLPIGTLIAIITLARLVYEVFFSS